MTDQKDGNKNVFGEGLSDTEIKQHLGEEPTPAAEPAEGGDHDGDDENIFAAYDVSEEEGKRHLGDSPTPTAGDDDGSRDKVNPDTDRQMRELLENPDDEG